MNAARTTPALGRAWFALTRDERLALTIVLALFILGLLSRWYCGGRTTIASEAAVNGSGREQKGEHHEP